MAGSTQHEAIENFVGPLQQSVSCVTPELLRFWLETYDWKLVLGVGRPIPLLGSTRIDLAIRMRFKVVEAAGELGPFKVSITGYDYELHHRGVGKVLAYEWHPIGRSRVTFPHVHLGFNAPLGGMTLGPRVHLPTGRVSVEEVLRLAINDLSVAPVPAHLSDWGSILGANHAKHAERRLWA